ncbi:hypothetical protein SDC9_54529 [bioreactor metagenome]|uniref:Plasmid pRiA4b Orf3-like domain-containing protein n=1 Tax=bioreactor metagenome TaxID=1076179 RepID=A0A644WWZ4_9ZZZZ
MHAYKFRITSDESDEFLREIDVLANQTFEDFHKTLVSTCKFAGNELASFYLCDNQWRKRREITLVDMNMADDDEDEKMSAPNIIMKDAKLNQVINDPHQKMIYVYDYLNMFTVNIELIKIGQADLTMHFPLITKEISDIIAPPTKLSRMVDEEEVFNEEELQGGEESSEEGDDENMTEEQFYNDDSSDF